MLGRLHNKCAVRLQRCYIQVIDPRLTGENVNCDVTRGKVLTVTSQTNIITPLHTADIEAKILQFLSKKQVCSVENMRVLVVFICLWFNNILINMCNSFIVNSC